MRRILTVVEGHGELTAVPNLTSRLAANIEVTGLVWLPPIRDPRIATERGLRGGCERWRRRADVGGLLVLRDDEDGCPHADGPAVAEILRTASLPCPATCVLCYREYESLFLASLESIAGRALPGAGGFDRSGLLPSSVFDAELESLRDVKGWLTAHMPKGRIYKETLDQLAMTQLVDFDIVRASGLAWFGTLERAIRHLSVAGEGEVYPPPVD